MQKINLAAAFATFSEHWSPRIAAEVSGHEVRLAKLLGPFDWHRHDDADEMFLVHRGRLRMELRDGVIELGEGEMLVVPAGVEHRPVAEEEVEVVVIERAGTRNTGNLENERTLSELKRLENAGG